MHPDSDPDKVLVHWVVLLAPDVEAVNWGGIWVCTIVYICSSCSWSSKPQTCILSIVERIGFRVQSLAQQSSVPILYSLCVVAPWKSISNHALQSSLLNCYRSHALQLGIVTEIYLALQSSSQIVMQMFDLQSCWKRLWQKSCFAIKPLELLQKSCFAIGNCDRNLSCFAIRFINCGANVWFAIMLDKIVIEILLCNQGVKLQQLQSH